MGRNRTQPIGRTVIQHTCGLTDVMESKGLRSAIKPRPEATPGRPDPTLHVIPWISQNRHNSSFIAMFVVTGYARKNLLFLFWRCICQPRHHLGSSFATQGCYGFPSAFNENHTGFGSAPCKRIRLEPTSCINWH
jgi:hypothetical protein